MFGLMQSRPLLVSSLLEHAALNHGDTEIISYTLEEGCFRYDYAGAERRARRLAKAMLAHPNFVLLDEPTNHLDLESITALNEALRDFTGNLIMTSHDHQLTQTVANRIIEITPNGMIDSLMEFNDYLKAENIQAQRAELQEVVTI